MPARLAGVIFDMDGTLVKQKLDFAKVRAGETDVEAGVCVWGGGPARNEGAAR